jgi:hypothetical protein
MRRAARIDNNQTEIVDCVRRWGGEVMVLSAVGRGCPDIAILYKDTLEFWEIKTETGKLTPDQIRWHERWSGAVRIIRSVEDANTRLAQIALKGDVDKCKD